MPAINIQDNILQYLKEQKEAVKIFLMKGFQIQGTVLDFDTFVILLESEGKKQLISLLADPFGAAFFSAAQLSMYSFRRPVAAAKLQNSAGPFITVIS